MKSESEPITEDEWLLRRVRIEKFRTDSVPLISPNAFEPRTKGRDVDEDGISLYREACLPNPEAILAILRPDQRTQNGVVRVPVRALAALGLTVRAAPCEPIPGHVVIPELNADDYRRNAARFTGVKHQLAVLASAQVAVSPGAVA